jgi:hypothetical protein
MVGSLNQLMKFVPVDEEKVISLGLQHFLRNQDPENVDFVSYPNGWALEIKTDEDNVEDARQFWEDNIEGKL